MHHGIKKPRHLGARFLWCGLAIAHLHGLKGLVLHAVTIVPLHAVLVFDHLPVELIDE